MGILDKIIKKEEKDANETSAKPQAVKKAVKKDTTKKSEAKKIKTDGDEKKQPVKAESKKKKVSAKENTPIVHFDLIRRPHISEKAFYSGEENKYVFKVSDSANKSEVKKAVENLYGVSVEKVNMILVPEKPKIYRGVRGEKSGFKKAIVKLKKGDTIDVIEGV